MESVRAPALYTPDLLALAVELAAFPLDQRAQTLGHARSRSCGSVIDVSSSTSDELRNIGLKVSACAVGQASAAIFAREALGMTMAEVEDMLAELQKWLDGKQTSSVLPRLELLEPARLRQGRHEAILLPWRAALDALSKNRSAR